MWLTGGPDELAQHLPGLQDMESVLDFLPVCVFGYLGNVLDGRTYLGREQGAGLEMSGVEMAEWKKYDVNAMPDLVRERCTYVRGLAQELLRWFVDRHDLVICRSDGSEKLVEREASEVAVYKQVAYLVLAAKWYKRSVVSHGQESSDTGSCMLEMVEEQVDGCVGVGDASMQGVIQHGDDWWARQQGSGYVGLWSGLERFKMVVRDGVARHMSGEWSSLEWAR